MAAAFAWDSGGPWGGYGDGAVCSGTGQCRALAQAAQAPRCTQTREGPRAPWGQMADGRLSREPFTKFSCYSSDLILQKKLVYSSSKGARATTHMSRSPHLPRRLQAGPACACVCACACACAWRGRPRFGGYYFAIIQLLLEPEQRALR